MFILPFFSIFLHNKQYHYHKPSTRVAVFPPNESAFSIECSIHDFHMHRKIFPHSTHALSLPHNLPHCIFEVFSLFWDVGAGAAVATAKYQTLQLPRVQWDNYKINVCEREGGREGEKEERKFMCVCNAILHFFFCFLASKFMFMLYKFTIYTHMVILYLVKSEK